MYGDLCYIDIWVVNSHFLFVYVLLIRYFLTPYL